MLAEQWKLPAECQTIAGRHHDHCDGDELDLLRIVHIACRAADSLGYCITRPRVPLDFEAILSELPTRLRLSPDDMRERIQKRIEAYQGHVEERRDESDPTESSGAADSNQQDEPKSSTQSRGLYIAAAMALLIGALVILLLR